MDPERIHPLGNRILIKPDEPEGITKSGLIIPDIAKKPTGTGVVVAMGPGMLRSNGERWVMPDIKPGDRVIFDARNPFPRIELDGVELLQMRDDTILAVFEDGSSKLTAVNE